MSPSPFPDQPDTPDVYPNNSANNGHGHPQLSDPSNQDAAGINILARVLGEDAAADLDDNLPTDTGERFDRARRSAMTVYAVLIAIGIVIGGVTLVGIALLMQHFGLTDVPAQVDQQ
ncbi:MAG: hypothetical protein F6K30_11865 [Cyanothece sp. SIO2G6]|nr:hypothetical protein [Cyanothece sp. SIO2G6]